MHFFLGSFRVKVDFKSQLSHASTIKNKEDSESLQSSTTPDPGHHMGMWQNKIKHYTQESQKVSLFPADVHKAASNRQDSKQKQACNINNKTESTKSSTALVFWFALMLSVPVNNYVHVGMVTSPNHTFCLGKHD